MKQLGQRLAERGMDSRTDRSRAATTPKSWIRFPKVQWQFCDGDTEHFIVSPGGAVCLSVTIGLAKGTLRLCKGCGRLVAFPKIGWLQKYCDECHSLKGPTDETKARLLDLEKRARWRLVHDRVYRRVLKRGSQRKLHGGLHAKTTNFRKKHVVMDPENRAKWNAWKREAWAALIQARDVEDWEKAWAPKMKRGPRPKTSRGANDENPS
jgi:hypothetical protein